ILRSALLSFICPKRFVTSVLPFRRSVRLTNSATLRFGLTYVNTLQPDHHGLSLSVTRNSTTHTKLSVYVCHALPYKAIAILRLYSIVVNSGEDVKGRSRLPVLIILRRLKKILPDRASRPW